MKLIDVLRKECVFAGARLSDKAAVLRQIVQTAKKSSILKLTNFKKGCLNKFIQTIIDFGCVV